MKKKSVGKMITREDLIDLIWIDEEQFEILEWVTHHKDVKTFEGWCKFMKEKRIRFRYLN